MKSIHLVRVLTLAAGVGMVALVGASGIFPVGGKYRVEAHRESDVSARVLSFKPTGCGTLFKDLVNFAHHADYASKVTLISTPSAHYYLRNLSGPNVTVIILDEDDFDREYGSNGLLKHHWQGKSTMVTHVDSLRSIFMSLESIS